MVQLFPINESEVVAGCGATFPSGAQTQWVWPRKLARAFLHVSDRFNTTMQTFFQHTLKYFTFLNPIILKCVWNLLPWWIFSHNFGYWLFFPPIFHSFLSTLVLLVCSILGPSHSLFIPTGGAPGAHPRLQQVGHYESSEVFRSPM